MTATVTHLRRGNVHFRSHEHWKVHAATTLVNTAAYLALAVSGVGTGYLFYRGLWEVAVIATRTATAFQNQLIFGLI
jgi:hypothetical protein